MKHSFVSPITGLRETPIRLLIKHFPDLAKKVSMPMIILVETFVTSFILQLIFDSAYDLIYPFANEIGIRQLHCNQSSNVCDERQQWC